MNFVVIHAVENKPFDLVSRGKICNFLNWNDEKGKGPLKASLDLRALYNLLGSVYLKIIKKFYKQFLQF